MFCRPAHWPTPLSRIFSISSSVSGVGVSAISRRIDAAADLWRGRAFETVEAANEPQPSAPMFTLAAISGGRCSYHIDELESHECW